MSAIPALEFEFLFNYETKTVRKGIVVVRSLTKVVEDINNQVIYEATYSLHIEKNRYELKPIEGSLSPALYKQLNNVIYTWWCVEFNHHFIFKPQ